MPSPGSIFSKTLFSKLAGTGNDFILVARQANQNGLDAEPSLSSLPGATLAQRLCDRHQGVGADGFLILTQKSQPNVWGWEFFNADGSTAEMCGNAARCATLWARRWNPSSTAVEFLTTSGVVVGELISEFAKVTMPKVSATPTPLRHCEGGVDFVLINSGVPHAVAELKLPPRPAELIELARSVRRLSLWGERGANVTFYFPKSVGEILAVTYERGVEDFTLSCGTGAVAAAWTWSEKSRTQSVAVHVPGGQLRVDIESAGPRLSGEAHWICEFQVPLTQLG